MSEVMVSVRMPQSLYKGLKRNVELGSFMDLSELVRSIIRHRFLEARNPELLVMRKLKNEVREELSKKGEHFARTQVLLELEKIKQELKKENSEGELL